MKYELKDKKNGVYVFVLNGQFIITRSELEKRDG
ncbi:MAG: hypothetical protein KA270_12640 [Saprospiraceae bacterium]|nr:hypothetical protein [Saprospiraceae bacterium]MBP6568009.1 hypothetical protein [Saprospiraceae bacterium]